MYSIIVPVYNSGKWLTELADGISAAMQNGGHEFELILVNDNSSDRNTWAQIEQLARRFTWIKGIDLLYNVGQFRATLCGIEHARGSYIITMDDDFQHPPDELPKLIEAMRCKPDMDCIMGKYQSKQHGLLRNAGSRLVRQIMTKLYNKPRDVVTTSFRIMPAEFARTVALYRVAHPQMGPLIVSLTNKVENIPVKHNSRSYGRSGYSLRSSVRETFHSIVNASVFPLRLLSLIGFATAGFAFFISAWFFLRWSFGGIGVQGFTSLILTISFFSGMILIGIGVLGEYVRRVINELTGMPRYYVRKSTDELHK